MIQDFKKPKTTQLKSLIQIEYVTPYSFNEEVCSNLKARYYDKTVNWNDTKARIYF